MRTDQLQVMVSNLRAECGHSLDVAQGKNQETTLKYLLARTQEELWTAFVWPDLVIRAEVQMTAGQFAYPYPPTMPFDQIRETWTADPDSANWRLLDYGINEDRIKPGGANTERADPIRAWDVESSTMFRVFPTPDAGGNWVRFKGMKALGAFTANTDVSTLDSTAIVLFCASDLLARAKAEDATVKQQHAQRHLLKLLGNKISAKNKITVMGGGSPRLRGRDSNIQAGNYS